MVLNDEISGSKFGVVIHQTTSELGAEEDYLGKLTVNCGGEIREDGVVFPLASAKVARKVAAPRGDLEGARMSEVSLGLK